MPFAVAQEKSPAWSYDDDYTGQEEWGLIDPVYAACGIGTEQSPIHIAYTEEATLPTLNFSYKNTQAMVQNIGFTPEITFPGNEQVLEENGERFLLEKIHFHTPSEHVVKDKFYGLEIHLIHTNLQGKKLIVAVFATFEKPLPAFDTMLASLSPKTGEKHEIQFNPSLLLPVYRGYYAYDGSLTQPPCTEGVRWRVMKAPIDIAKSQLAKLAEFTGRNARLTQPVYMRTVKEFKDNW